MGRGPKPKKSKFEAKRPGRHWPGAHPVSEVCGMAWQEDLGEERGWSGGGVHLYTPSTPW